MAIRPVHLRLQARCEERGVKHVRFRIRDFDPFDLRRKLPKVCAHGTPEWLGVSVCTVQSLCFSLLHHLSSAASGQA